MPGKDDDWSQRFAEETGVHGLTQLFRSKTKTEKSIWVVIVVCAFVLVGVGIAKTIWEYIHQPVATKFTLGRLKAFPSLLVCTPYWVNESRARQIGMTRADYRHFGLTALYPHAFAWFSLPASNDEAEYNQTLGPFLEKFGNLTVDEITLRISNDHDEVALMPSSNFDAAPFFKASQALTTTRGACTLLESSMLIPPVIGSEQGVLVVLKQQKKAFGVSGFHFPHLFVGDQAHALHPKGSVRFAPGKVTAVQLKPTKLSLNPGRPGGCRKDAGYSTYEQCAIDVLSQHCVKYGSGAAYVPHRNRTVQQSVLWTCDTDAKNNQGRTAVEEIQARCKMPCRRVMYQVTATTLADGMNGVSALDIRVSDPDRAMVFEEFFAISMDGFISNLGGQISLYTGASLITLIHVFIFCMFVRQ